MTNKRKKIIIFSVISVAVVAVIAIVIGVIMNQDKEIMTINGEKICQQEFEFYINQNRASVASYFSKTFGADIDSGFWDRDYEGKKPKQMLIDKAIEDLKFNKAIFIDCKQMEIINDITYDTFLKNMKNENERKKVAIEKGEVVYGVSEYSQQSYFDYIKSNLVLKQREIMKKNGKLNPSDLDLKLFHKEIKDKYAYLKEKDGTYKEYGAVRAKLVSLYVEKEYTDYINVLVSKLDINVNSEQLQKIVIAD